jgi:hypothetical protein
MQRSNKMPELPSNAFDHESKCVSGELPIGEASAPTTIKVFIKAVKGKDNSECDLRVETRSPNLKNPKGPPVVTPIGLDIAAGTGMLKLINLAANDTLWVRCLGEKDTKKCRLTVTFYG